ncbi:MAG: acyl-homoserine-lactone synthase, partial [Pseudomonadota bacterium]
NARSETLYGSLRLLPTTGPTLLYDVFRTTFPNNASLSAPGIWEGTRLCVDNDALARNGLNIDPRLAFCMMLLALCETALDHGIHTMVSNYEPPTRRLYTMAGAPIQEIGRSDGFGRRPVCAGTLEVSETVLATMQHRLGISERLMAPKSSTNPRIQHSQSIAPHHGGFSEPENPRGAFKHDTVAA